jgi:hypothetical protein
MPVHRAQRRTPPLRHLRHPQVIRFRILAHLLATHGRRRHLVTAILWHGRSPLPLPLVRIRYPYLRQQLPLLHCLRLRLRYRSSPRLCSARPSVASKG